MDRFVPTCTPNVDKRAGSGVHENGCLRCPSSPAISIAFGSLVVVLVILMALLCPCEALAADGSAGRTFDGALDRVVVSAEGSASVDGSGFGLNGFERIAKGTARRTEGAPEGFRFPIDEGASVIAIRTPENVLVHIDVEATEPLGGREAIEARELDLWAIVCALDREASMGGPVFASMDVPYRLVFDESVEQGAYRYRFDARAADGSRFATVSLAGAQPGTAGSPAAREAGVDLGDGALWCDFAELVPESEVAAEEEPGALGRVVRFLSSVDYRPFWVSLKTSGLALAISFVAGLAAAWCVMGTSSRIKAALDSVFTIPMVLPPTVCGFLLLMAFGQSSALGRWLAEHGVSIVFTWQAAVISAVVVSFPLVYRTALGAFESLEPAMLDAARTLGWPEFRIFARLMMPLAWPSIAAGTVLAFARAMGEFGCTLFFAGNYAGVTQTIPIAIYFEWMGGDTQVAMFWVIVVIAFSFLVIGGINAYAAHCVSDGSARSADGASAEVQDGLEETGGDALRIDAEALARLLGDEVL